MSRYLIASLHPVHEITVGWDGPLSSYFATVIDPTLPEEDEIVLWLGTTPYAVSSVDALQAQLKAYATIPSQVRQRLEQDYAARTPPTALQRMMLAKMLALCAVLMLALPMFVHAADVGLMPPSVVLYEQKKAELPTYPQRLSLCKLLAHPHEKRFWVPASDVGEDTCDLRKVILAFGGFCEAGFRDRNVVHFSRPLVPNAIIHDYADGTVIYLNHAFKYDVVTGDADELAAIHFLQTLPHVPYDVRGDGLELFAPGYERGFPLKQEQPSPTTRRP